jgi:hypothetical protein
MMLKTTRAGWVVCGLLVVLTAGCAAQPGSSGSSRTAEEAAAELARESVELGGLDRMLDTGAELGWAASLDAFKLELGREPTDDEQERGRATMRAVLAEFLTADLWEESVTRVYAQHFTADELEELLGFYTSPVGQKSLRLEGQLADEIDDGVEQMLGEEGLDRFIDRLDAALSQAFPELGDEAGS